MDVREPILSLWLSRENEVAIGTDEATMEESRVIYSVVGGRATITLNRPEKRNALDRETVDLLRKGVIRAREEEAHSIVLQGNGPVFCAGADLAYLKKMQGFSVEENLDDSRALANTLLEIYRSPVPVIARVHGHAIAGGCGLATVCDVVVAVADAKFGYTEVGIGFVPAIVAGFLMNKAQQIGTRELLLTGKIVNAVEAERRGLVTTVVSDVDALDKEIDDIVDRLSRVDSGAVGITKELLNSIEGATLDNAIDYGVRVNALARSRDACKEGIAAFLSKQKND